MTPTDPIDAMVRAHYEWRTVVDKFDDLPVEYQQDEINSMRAALTALRDCGVTEGMVKAGHLDRDVASVNYEFRAMLDAALDQS